jgi:hypothetical protein
MGIHIGKRIKDRAKELRMGATELGRLINTTRQNVHDIFDRKSIDTEQLLDISKALTFNFFSLYEDELSAKVDILRTSGDNENPLYGPEVDKADKYERSLQEAFKRIELLEQIDILKRLEVLEAIVLNNDGNNTGVSPF